jgi:predicted nucleic acid-binding protein
VGPLGRRGLKYLLDSVILIDHFNGRSEATQFLRDHDGEMVLSVITRAEVLAGFDPDGAVLATALLDRFPALAMDLPIADLAARLRRENRWKMPDAVQAALAQYHALTLVTRNTRDFPPERFPFVKVPYI